MVHQPTPTIPSQDTPRLLQLGIKDTATHQSAINKNQESFLRPLPSPSLSLYYATVTLHVELPPDMDLDESHKRVHLVQDKIVDEIDVVHGATVHACPAGLEYDHDQQLDEGF